MKKIFKIMLACANAVFFIAVIGLGIWKIADASSSTNNGQHSSVKRAFCDSDIGVSANDSNGGTGSIKITTQDGIELTLMNPAMLGDLLNADYVEFSFTNPDHAENRGVDKEQPAEGSTSGE